MCKNLDQSSSWLSEEIRVELEVFLKRHRKKNSIFWAAQSCMAIS